MYFLDESDYLSFIDMRLQRKEYMYCFEIYMYKICISIFRKLGEKGRYN